MIVCQQGGFFVSKRFEMKHKVYRYRYFFEFDYRYFFEFDDHGWLPSQR